MSELNLKNILIKSNFFINYNDLEIFFLEGLVHLNGSVCENINIVLRVSDVLSISFNKHYFLYSRNKIDNVNFSANRLVSHNFKKSFFKKKYNNKIKNFLHHRLDIPKFLEIDYLTMTIVVLYKPILRKD